MNMLDSVRSFPLLARFYKHARLRDGVIGHTSDMKQMDWPRDYRLFMKVRDEAMATDC